ncbi:hypothetical protein [Adhaeretor mobilis]|uniref:hypothetical protein n=1 Tax=Adhaeretor mobilis TaxID=1930276 RepID=UPI0011A886DE|nr:hypothetical protein [Adhaeretor mobilis]
MSSDNAYVLSLKLAVVQDVIYPVAVTPSFEAVEAVEGSFLDAMPNLTAWRTIRSFGLWADFAKTIDELPVGRFKVS